MNSRRAWVYVLWSDSTPLYIGCTTDWVRRMREHRVLPSMGWPREWALPITHTDLWEFATLDEALQHEAAAIWDLRSLHNRRGTGTHDSVAESAANTIRRADVLAYGATVAKRAS